ncbi:hypothetical protein NEIPOLOT_00114 [Neisseria polysaccharea ATCC 43768]|nr:hypothetical protein NEIPOLOT_00114 [Neisseria polysaccharea ATCC 43768]
MLSGMTVRVFHCARPRLSTAGASKMPSEGSDGIGVGESASRRVGFSLLTPPNPTLRN